MDHTLCYPPCLSVWKVYVAVLFSTLASCSQILSHYMDALHLFIFAVTDVLFLSMFWMVLLWIMLQRTLAYKSWCEPTSSVLMAMTQMWSCRVLCSLWLCGAARFSKLLYLFTVSTTVCESSSVSITYKRFFELTVGVHCLAQHLTTSAESQTGKFHFKSSVAGLLWQAMLPSWMVYDTNSIRGPWCPWPKGACGRGLGSVQDRWLAPGCVTWWLHPPWQSATNANFNL